MKDIVSVFREYARLDLMRKGSGLCIAELERWKNLKDQLDHRMQTPGEVVANEKRSSARLATHLNCSYRSNYEPRDAAVTQLSTGGVFISTRTPLQIGTDLILRIRLEASGSEIVVAGCVVSNNVGTDLLPGKMGMGVRFTNVSPETIDALSELYARESCERSVSSVRQTRESKAALADTG